MARHPRARLLGGTAGVRTRQMISAAASVPIAGGIVIPTPAPTPTPTPTASLPSSVKITTEGDSITAGAGDDGNKGGWPGRIMALLTAGPAYTRSNVAVSGDTVSKMNDKYATDQNTPNAFDASKALNVFALLGGVNDGAVNQRAAVYKNLRFVIAKARQTGFQKVLAATLVARSSLPGQAPLGDSYFDATTLPLNQDLRALWDTDLDADGLIDFGGAAGMSVATDADSDRYADKLHPSAKGYDIMAPVAAAAINGVIAGNIVRGKGPGTWSYFDKSDQIALSNGNRTASATHGNYLNAAISIFSEARRGKVGWEVSIDNSGFVEKGFDTVMLALNCRASKFYQMGNSFGDNSDAYLSIKPNGDLQYNGGTVQGNIGPLRTGSTVTICVDMTGATKLAWIRRNSGAWNGNGSADPATGVGGIDVTAVYSVDVNVNNAGVGPRQASFCTAARLYCTPAIVTTRLKAAEITVPLPSGFGAIA